jgi:hypothetical protein
VLCIVILSVENVAQKVQSTKEGLIGIFAKKEVKKT